MHEPLAKTMPRDLISGLVVFLVALPLCLGVALASNPKGAEGTAMFVSAVSGLIAGVVGGIVVGIISKSHTSVSGPAAGLTAVVATQVQGLGSFQAFTLAILIAGILQVLFGVFRLGFISGFFPNCVIKGLLAAIGMILILKQIPHLFGHDTDVEGEMSFEQPDGRTTFSELIETAFDIDIGSATIGLACLVLLLLWDRIKVLKSSIVPAPLVVVLLGVLMAELFRRFGNATWVMDPLKHFVNVPVLESLEQAKGIFKFPDWSAFAKPAVYTAAITVAIVASLETLLNVEAVDKLDPRRRITPTNRELVAQGVGNITCGLIGGLPVTSVIVRSSVNIIAGGRTKLAAIWHGILLLGCSAALPTLLNKIPLSALAAILIATGLKLFSWKLIKSMWQSGWTQFLPFAVTVAAIYRTDLLVGILIGLGVSIAFILASNLRRPLWRVVEKHVGGEVVHIHLANQVSFLNRGLLNKTFESFEPGTHVLLDARDTEFIDPDILDMIREFEQEQAPARNIKVSMVGFKSQYDQVEDKILFADYTSRELRDQLTPDGVLQILKDGNARFCAGTRISRDLNRQMQATAAGQFPMAAVLSCIDSRAPVELLFDVGLGDIFTARIAGNVGRDKVLGSLEYASVVAGVKLIVVMGHSKCGAVGAAVDLAVKNVSAFDATGCDHLDNLVAEIQQSVDVPAATAASADADAKQAFVDDVARKNVTMMMKRIVENSQSIRKKVEAGDVKVVGCFYDISTGKVTFEL
jgi:carbonic anhydrase/SulP family sulfate permease